MSSENSALVSVVPWYDAAQFKRVYEHIYSNDLNKMKWAHDAISVWETRCHPSLPTAIEATYVLLSAVIQDILWKEQKSFIHFTDLQGIYGASITRFVSLTVEVNKKKDVPSYSIAEVAKSIGIPSFIVDVRNEWCHSGRPSLQFLRLAANDALRYLKTTYWEKEVKHVCNYVKQPLDETELHILFQEFIQFYDDTITSKKNKALQSDDGTVKMNPEYVRILRKLEKHLKQHKRLFIKVLVSEGIFIPTDEDFKRMVSSEDYVLFNRDYYLDDDDDEELNAMCYENDYSEAVLFEAKNIPEVPQYHESLWEHVIALLNQYDSVPFFMESLLESQGNRTIIGQKLLVSWILDVLRLHSACGFTTKVQCLKKIFRRKGFVMNWYRLLHSAVVNPCKYTLSMLPLILKNLNIEKEVAIRITGIITLKLGMVNHFGQKGNYPKLFHTVDELKQALEYQRNHKNNKSVENIWSLCPDGCHKFWPIGNVINPVKETVVDDDDEERNGNIVESIPELGFAEGFIISNKNEDEEDDDDPTYKVNAEEPDIEKIKMEVQKRKSLLYRETSGE